MTRPQRSATVILAGFAFVVIAVLGVVLTIAIGNLIEATDKVNDNVVEANKSLAIGRYERVKFQIDQRRLTCLDLQDGDTGATDEQYAECAEDYIKLPPKPKGYDE